jgi:hypothetical protein
MNRLLAGGGIAALALGLFLLVMPVAHIPLLDANRTVLAESEAEGQCAGNIYAKSRGYGDPDAMKSCLASSNLNPDVDWVAVQPAFCRGVISGGVPVSQDDCLGIMEAREFWPTATGKLTNSWNGRFPYPGGTFSSARPGSGGESRTGDREETEREGFSR